MKVQQVFSVVAAVACLFATLVDGLYSCTNIPKKCKCSDNTPRALLLLLDVSRSIDPTELWEKYLPGTRGLTCGLNWSEDHNNEDGTDAVGVIAFGYQTKVIVPLKRYTKENFEALINQFNEDSSKVRHWFKCCTPVGTALEVAGEEFTAARNDGRTGFGMTYHVHLVSDGFPVMNRLRFKHNQRDRSKTQEKSFKSLYLMRIVPRMAENLKQNWDAQISISLLENRVGEPMQESVDYFKGQGPARLFSRKRKYTRFYNKKVFRGRGRWHTKGPYAQIVSSPADDYIHVLSALGDSDDFANHIIQTVCTGELVDQNTQCTPSPPTPEPTSKPTTPTPTITTVTECRGAKDLIFIVDSSNSISWKDRTGGRAIDYVDNVLPLVEELMRINGNDDPAQRTAVITFSEEIKLRIPLAHYSHAEFRSLVEDIKDDYANIISCCTPTAEAMELATEIILSRTGPYSDNDVIVFIITDGLPMMNKPPYKNGEGHTQYRRASTTTHSQHNAGTGDIMTFAEYYSRQVFVSGQALKAVAEVFLLGAPTKFGNPTAVDYFIGADYNSVCRTVFSGSQGGDNIPKPSCSSVIVEGGTDNWHLGWRTYESNVDLGPLVSAPVDQHSLVADGSWNLAKLISDIRSLLCNEG
mmetsp:Transcript_11131/g.20671  ORF Transcript_11131/g.20671 Transcript_11131/m.20671 type:complete len:639 (-) Transcript_11131:2504-4420(-)